MQLFPHNIYKSHTDAQTDGPNCLINIAHHAGGW